MLHWQKKAQPTETTNDFNLPKVSNWFVYFVGFLMLKFPASS